uniref:Tetratricopeptide repeat protein n=1 Tax=candidate division WOR-3 bacterium TaxID=2052148 RepID=A0A7C4YG80_UNCW3
MGKQEKINELKIKAKNFLLKNKFDDAIKLYEKILEIAPDDLKSMTELAEIYVKKGDNQDAKKLYWKILESYKSLDYYSNAIAIAQKLLKLGEDELQMLEIIADLYAKQGLFGDATSAYYRIAEKYSKENDINGVLSTYKKIVELIPKKTDIREQLVKIFISQNKIEDAIEQLNILKEIYSEQGRVEEVDRIDNTIASLKGEKVVKEEKEEEIVFEQSKTVFTEEVEVKKKEEKRVEVEEKKEKEEKKEEEGIVSELEELLEEQKTEAKKEREIPEPDIKSIEKSVTDWMDWLTVAQLYESIGSNDDAVDYYSKAADYFFDTDNLVKAEEIYKKISDLKPFEIRPIQKLIQIALRINDKDKAVEYYVALYNCLMKRGAEEEAKNALDKAMKINPEHPLLKEVLPEEKTEEVILEKKETEGIKFEDLLKEEEKGISIKIEEKVPGEENIEYLLSQFKQKIFENISAEDYSSHYDLGLTYKEMGLLDEAIEQFKISMKGEKEKLKSLEMLGKCYEEKGDIRAAELIYKKTIENEKGKNPIPLLAFHYHLGTLYASQNRINDAINEFKEIIKIDPNFGDVKEKIKELNLLLTQPKASK